MCIAADTSRCDEALVRCTQANLEEGKCELVKFSMADQRIQPTSNKKKLLVNFSHSLYDFYRTGVYFLCKTRLSFYLLLHSIVKGKIPWDCSGCSSCSTRSVAILNGFLRDHGKIIDVPLLVDLNFVATTCHASTRLLALILSPRYVVGLFKAV